MFIFPAHRLTPGTVKRYLERQVLSGGTSLSGEQDVIESDGGGRWVVEYGDISLVSADDARLWEAWSEYLSGGTTRCLVPLLSFATGPRPAVSSLFPKRPSELYYDNAEWPTVLAYAARDHKASISATGLLRDTEVSLSIERGAEPRGGELFSYAGRLHRVIRKNDAGKYVVRPPLRENTNIGTPVSFDFPLLQATADPSQNFAVALSRGRHGTASIRFVESI